MSEENLIGEECTGEIGAEEPIIQLTENGVEGFEVLCRLCANRSEHLISIYGEEGIANDLPDKMNLYLPVKVAKTDLLPLQCCFQCASTVLAWHELIIACVEADRRLRDIQTEVEKQLIQQNGEPGTSQMEIEAPKIEEDGCTVPVSKLNTKIEEKNVIVHQNVNKIKVKPSVRKKQIEKTIALTLDEESGKINFDEQNTASNSASVGARKTYQCAECNREFPHKKSLARHILIHKDIRSFTCHICGKGFRDESHLKRHIRHVHQGIKNFQCEVCLESFASSATRNDHLRRHTKERPFVCSQCGKNFAHKASLYIHSKRHSDVFPFNCNVCGKKFKRGQELKMHSSVHSGEKPFQCSDCGKLFRTKTLLTAHGLIHSKEMPFSCDVCGMAFRQLRYLKNHLNSKHQDSK